LHIYFLSKVRSSFAQNAFISRCCSCNGQGSSNQMTGIHEFCFWMQIKALPIRYQNTKGFIAIFFYCSSCVGTNFHCQLYHRLASNIFCNYSTGVEIPSMSMHQTVPLERYKCEKDSKLWSKNKAVVDDRQCDDCHCTETEESLCTNRRTPILKGLL